MIIQNNRAFHWQKLHNVTRNLYFMGMKQNKQNIYVSDFNYLSSNGNVLWNFFPFLIENLN